MPKPFKKASFVKKAPPSKKATPAKKASPVRPYLLWCIPCARKYAIDFDPSKGKMFRIDCLFEPESNNSKCLACQTRRQCTCILTCEGMHGNAYDMVRLVEWLAPLFEDKTGRLGKEQRIEVAGLAKRLCLDFLGLELEHRKEHDLTGICMVEDQRGAEAYVQFALGRHRDLATTQAPDVEETEPEYVSWSLLRLLPGDSGYEDWLKSLQKYEEAVKPYVKLYYEEEW
ncbi:hypothetical protein N7454_008483 [Penicillium verhagenii]|nr:hypothetical protein N7454_008483 [Penicillium verhagenii]